MRDVRELELTSNRTASGASASGAADFICPVTGVEMNGKHRLDLKKLPEISFVVFGICL